MKKVLRDFAAAFFLGFVLPSFLLGTVMLARRTDLPERKKQMQDTCLEKTIRNRLGLQGKDLSDHNDLDAYLVGVVLAEMPVEFEPEALKAQAVAARTYARKALETGGKHGDGSVCREPGCCQAYISPLDYLNRGGTPEGLEKVTAAVEATAGWVLTYEGELIEATYFSCSGGRTEDAAVVWGTEYPYLKAVDSPGEEAARYYRDTVWFTPEEFAELLGLVPGEDVDCWFGSAEYTRGGSVKQLHICGAGYSGIQLRSALGLRSAAFDLDVVDGRIRIITRGYGHRVGMSQYGADAMAVAGHTYDQILAHYYPGAELTLLEPDCFPGRKAVSGSDTLTDDTT